MNNNSFLNNMIDNSNKTLTMNGAVTNRSSGRSCLDLFFAAGAMRQTPEEDIAAAVTRAYAEDPVKTMKIVFFARDARGGLGERRFFRIAVKALAQFAPEAVERNIPYIAEFGRYDDLLSLLGTQCADRAMEIIAERLKADIASMREGGKVSLLAKWLPSVNASSEATRNAARDIAAKLGYSERNYRKTLSELRAYTDILENRLRVRDYTFDYEKQPSCAMFKYRKAFIRNDNERYMAYLNAVNRGEAKLNASVLYPYQIVERCLGMALSGEETLALDTTWKNLPVFGESGNNIAVVDGSGSMCWAPRGVARPLDVALSLGIYFAEHNKGIFANRFITFSRSPQMAEVKGRNIVEKVRYCATFNEVANTNIEAVFNLILAAAVNGKAKQEELPEKIFIISDMEFDQCAEGGNDLTLYDTMKAKYKQYGYKLPDVVFWNVRSYGSNVPVTFRESGTALVSGFTPALFDMVMGGEISPEIIMNRAVESERYAMVS